MHMHTWHTIISTFWWWIYQKDEVSIEKSEWVSLIEGWMTTCCLHCTLSKFWVFLVTCLTFLLNHFKTRPSSSPPSFLPLPSSLGWLYTKFDSHFIGLGKIQPISGFMFIFSIKFILITLNLTQIFIFDFYVLSLCYLYTPLNFINLF